jgi:Zn-finger domain-containing protein
VTAAVKQRSWGRSTDHIGLGVVSARFGRDLLEEILNRSGRREKRSRRLPAHVMVRYVIAMGLFFAESYDEVMRRLVGNLPKLGPGTTTGGSRPSRRSPRRGSDSVSSR